MDIETIKVYFREMPREDYLGWALIGGGLLFLIIGIVMM